MKYFTVIVLIIFLIANSCNPKNNNRSVNIEEYYKEYKVIYSDQYIHSKEYDVISQTGILLIEFYDSLLTYNDAFNIIREICISENLIQSDIYYVIDEPFDTLLKKIENSEVENYYLGEFDARNKGMNWKYLIELSDMNFNIEESSKIKIKTKFSKESRFAI